MLKSRLPMLAVAVAWAASAAHAAPLDGASLQNRLLGSEIRVNFLGSRGMEDHVWRLQDDGTIAAAYLRAPIANDRGALESGSGIGRWTVQASHLCVQMQGVFAGQVACFVVDIGPGDRVTLVGAGPARAGTTLGFLPQPDTAELPVLRGTIHLR